MTGFGRFLSSSSAAYFSNLDQTKRAKTHSNYKMFLHRGFYCTTGGRNETAFIQPAHPNFS